MGVPFSREKVIKALVNTCECIVGVILVLSVISPNSVSFAQDSSMTAYSVKNLSSDHYTLLPSPPRYIFQDMRVTGVPDIPSSRSVSTFWDPELSLQGNLQKDRPVLDWETGSGKSYLIPALEILGLNLVMNGVSRLAFPNDTENGKKVYDTNLSTFWDNLVHGSWGIDNDSFGTSQLRHPYQGAGYYGFARSAGLSYWESTAYTLGGIFLWTTGGETGNPSINDMISSGVAGPFLGESLFRMASLILEDGKPGFWRELGAAVISPPTGVNRLAFGDRFKAVFPSHDPAVFWRVRLGASWATYTRGGSSSDFEGNEGTAHFSMTYGLPGKPGYQYTRPFDYFKFEFKAGSNAGHLVENLMTYGLLLGKRYELGGSYRGIWGLYGSYDYISPDPFFRVSSTALSLGTTGQWWVSRSVTLQSSILAGLAYAGGGSTPAQEERDFHYGATVQSLVDLRLILGEMAMLEATQREYYISDVGSPAPQGSETIGHLNLGLTVRLYGHHALGVQWLFSSRDGDYAGMANQSQRMAQVTLVYNLLSDKGFGAVEWGRLKPSR
jgi:hypothetical protein